MGLAALWCGIFQTRDRTCVSYTGRWKIPALLSRNEDIMMGRKIFHKLLYYLPPSECTGNSIVCIRYLVPLQELLNQEHRGIKQATGYFKVWYQLYKHSSSEKTPCVSHSGQVIRRKDRFELPMPNTKPYMSEWTRFSAQSRKTGLPIDGERKCRDTPK